MLLQAGALVWCAVATGYDSLLGARCVLGFAAAAGEVRSRSHKDSPSLITWIRRIDVGCSIEYRTRDRC